MKLLLIGHPNVGKSVLFNRLTGANVTESNYPGTTVDYTKGYMQIDGEEVELIDVPGTFSLDPKDKAEEVAVKMLKDNEDSIVICVIDSTKIERGLYLALEIIEMGYPVVIALNMWDVAKDKDIEIDLQRLRELLGVPVVPTIAVSGWGVKELVSKIKDAKPRDISKIESKVEGTS
ncbi:MAG: 50S ribosome-binding GTPase [Candidatus Thermoplasmatota archaeon]|nr:50S ribosome-binding GTPase [Candidatus Thermoplasmatota archaeon]MBS3789426.1 50S ribosome-binding GTPase [Candidatus Thermoplasmatota archaeon]